MNDRWRRHGVAVLCLVLAPMLRGLVPDGWLFTPYHFLDPWYNIGYFLNYSDPAFLPGHYKEARLAWLVPGFLAYKALTPMIANYVLHVGMLVMAAVFTYLALARLVPRHAAFIAAALLCAYPPFHGSGGWDYQTTPSGAYFALTLYLLVRAAQSHAGPGWLIGAGAAFAAVIHSDIIFVNMGPGLAALYLTAARRRPTVRETAEVGGWVVLGFIGLTQALSMVNLTVGRSAQFYASLLDIVINYTANPTGMMAQWWKPWSSGWFLDAEALIYLAPLIAIFATSMVLLGARVRRLCSDGLDELGRHQARVDILLAAQYVFVFVLWLMWQSLGHLALQPDYFAYPLIVPAFLAVGALAGNAGRRDLILLATGLFAAVLAATFLPRWFLVGDGRAGLTVYAVLGLIVAAAIIVAARWPRASGAAVIAVAAAYLGLSPLARTTVEGLWTQLPVGRAACRTAGDAFAEAVRLNVLLRRDSASDVWVWDGPEETAPAGGCDVSLSHFRWAVMSTGITPLNATPAQPARDLPDIELSRGDYGDRIVAIVHDPALAEQLRARYALRNQALVVEYERPVHLGSARARVVVFELR